MSESYREHFRGEDKARAYESTQYAPTSYSELLWRIEQEQLQALIKELRGTHRRIDYLDFAAGTGRIIAFVEDKVDAATGIEISESMAATAREKLKKGRMICTDILRPNATIEGKYDLITAFRFFLNAEPALQNAGMKALAARLRDSTSILVFNNHGNFWSHKMLLWPFYKLRQLLKGRSATGNYLTTSQVVKLAEGAGLRIEEVTGSGLLSSKLMRLLSFDRTLRLERRLARWPLLPGIGVNQLYVAKLA